MQNEVTYCNNQSFENDIVVTQKTNCKNENNENNNLCIMCNQTKIKNRKGKLHELLTVDFARYYHANNGDDINTQFNNDYFEQSNSLNTQKGYSCNKVSINNKNKSNVTYKKQHNILQSTVILLSWLFVFVMSVMLIYFVNVNNNNLLNLKTNVVAEEVNTFADESTRVGNGTSGSPYQISTYADLVAFATVINDDAEVENFNTKYYKLNNNIKITAEQIATNPWEPIGYMAFGTGSDGQTFSGRFDGNGNTITFESKIIINEIVISDNYGDDMYYVLGSLFGSIKDAIITNLGVNYQGGIEISASRGGSGGYEVTSVFGGITAMAKNSTISNCYSEGTIVATSSTTVGSMSAGNTKCTGGGIVGVVVDGVTINNCYDVCKFDFTSTASLSTGIDAKYAGAYCYVGGIIGSAQHYVNNTPTNITINNCYSILEAEITNGGGAGSLVNYVGGIIGYVDISDDSICDIINCFSNFNLTHQTTITNYIGGVVGYCYCYYSKISALNISNEYYYINLDNISGVSYYSEGNVILNDSSQSKTQEELNSIVKNISNYTTNSSIYWNIDTYPWDFTNTWVIDTSSNDGYPYLKVFMEKYAVTYDLNGGTSWTGGDFTQYVQQGENANLTYTATKSGWAFVGWNTDANAITALTTYTPTNDTTLYAIWKLSNVDITFNITTNVGVIFNVYDNDNNFVQQMFVDNKPTLQTITTQLLAEKTYIIKISTIYTANINVSGGTLSGRTLTIKASASGSNITMTITGFGGSNSIII